MPPKPFVFKAPDGKEFTSKADYRDYMMANYFSYKNKKNEANPLLKMPGDVDGQVFDIADCENSTLVVMDKTEQVQIDNCTNCRIFIGSCSSSIFIRNCINCEFYTVCRQLRLREVIDCTFYIYSMAEVHIEYTNKVRFAPFNGGYPEQSKHMHDVNLDINHNLWYDIFDHNDQEKSKKNWSLLPKKEYGEPWFPAGVTCPVAIPITEPGSVKRTDLAEGGVGEAYGVDQMIKDAQSKSPPKNATSAVPPPVPASSKEDSKKVAAATAPIVPTPPPSDSKKISSIKKESSEQKNVNSKPITESPKPTSSPATASVSTVSNTVTVTEHLLITLETALLVMSATSKGINISLWFTIDKNDGKMPYTAFVDRLQSLGATVGMEEDWSTKKEIEIGTSQIALKGIIETCGSQKPTASVANSKSKKGTKETQGNTASNNVTIDARKFLSLCELKFEQYMNEMQGISSTITTINKLSGSDRESKSSNAEEIVQSYLSQISPDDVNSKSKTSANTASEKAKAVSSPSVKAAPVSPSQIKRRPTPVDTSDITPTKYATETIIPDSPYDEEVAFNVEDEDDAETTISKIVPSSRKSSEKPKRSPNNRIAERQAKAAANREAMKAAAKAQSSTGRKSLSNLDASLVSRKSIDSKRKAVSSSVARSINSAPVIKTDADIENIITKTVKQTDFYHIIQLHLGFIENHVLMPARGAPVKSKPRNWLSVQMIQKAFYECRVRLSEDQLLILFKLVKVFASSNKGKVFNCSSDSKAPGRLATETIVVSADNTLNSTWLKKYLLYLRLSKDGKRSNSASALRHSISCPVEANAATKTFIEVEPEPFHYEKTEPIAWQDWLDRKIENINKNKLKKPEEFKLSLEGKRSALSKEDVDDILVASSIIEDKLLDKEISIRVKSWILDTQGRRDFPHVLNIEIKKWQHDNPTLSWNKLPIANRNEIIASFTQKLMVDKATQLHLSEEKSASISKELYWKYYKENKQKNFAFTSTWSEWLKNRHNRLDNDIEKFQKNIHEREAAASASASRKRTVAPLIAIESKLDEVADTFARKGLTYYSIELRKSLVALRKTASEAGYGNGLVSKAIFDRHMTHVLAPRVADLPKDLKMLALDSPSSKVFISNQSEAIKRFTELDNDLKAKKNQTFKEWHDRKQTEKNEQV